MTNALSFDVEEYFCVTNFEDFILREEWESFPTRVEKQTDKILNLLAQAKVKATFFILGWLVGIHPDLIKKIFREGHEIGAHSWDHRLIYRQSPEKFRQDVKKTKKRLEDITGSEIKGYRGTSFSITRESLWALDILQEEGFKYDSTIFPVIHTRYGFSDSPRHPYPIRSKGQKVMWEFPLTTFKIGPYNLPVSGGGYMRLMNYNFLKWMLSRVNGREKSPFILYMHPWEFDPEQPIPERIPYLRRLRHTIGIRTMEKKLKQLLQDFQFAPIKDVLRDQFNADI